MKSTYLSVLFLGSVFLATSPAQAKDFTRYYNEISEFRQSPSNVAKQFHMLFKAEIYSNWKKPANSKGAYVRVNMFLKPDGTIKNYRITTISDELRHSMQLALISSQPFRVPRTAEAKRRVLKFEEVFFVE